MSKLVKVLVNDEVVLEYNRDIPLPEQQHAYLDNMDIMMAKGIELGGDKVSQPDLTQKAQFVALNMLSHLKQNDDAAAIAMFSYIVNRLPELKQIKAKYIENKVGVEFVFDRDHTNWQKVEFKPLKH